MSCFLEMTLWLFLFFGDWYERIYGSCQKYACGIESGIYLTSSSKCMPELGTQLGHDVLEEGSCIDTSRVEDVAY